MYVDKESECQEGGHWNGFEIASAKDVGGKRGIQAYCRQSLSRTSQN